MQIESDVVYKLGSVLVVGIANYFLVIRSIAIIIERQKVQKETCDKYIGIVEELEHQLTILQIKHDDNMCKSKGGKK
jgi:hypothetical protein